jgi:hypothetical protein
MLPNVVNVWFSYPSRIRFRFLSRYHFALKITNLPIKAMCKSQMSIQMQFFSSLADDLVYDRHGIAIEGKAADGDVRTIKDVAPRRVLQTL